MRPKGPFLTALVLAALGLVLAGGGARLIAFGGSWYYALAGIALLASAFLLWRGSRWGLRIYWALLAGTLIWSLAEAGLNAWALAPRLIGPSLIGLWLCTPWPRRNLDLPRDDVSRRRFRMAMLGIGGAAGVALIAAIGASVATHARGGSESAEPAAALGWPHVGNQLNGARFSEATQLTPRTVGGLREAWRFNTGEFSPTFEATPILADDRLVFCTARNAVFALDPETGRELWRFDPEADARQRMILVCRGVSHWSDPGLHGQCASRIFVATIDARLIALDAATGQRCDTFGNHGELSLMEGIGEHPPGFYYTTSPPLVVNDVLVVGAFVIDNQTVDAPSGVVRAFDTRTGALRWAWDMGAPERRGAPPPGETYTTGTPNVWSVMSADPELGLVYLPMGNPAPDFWGGNRRDFDERFGSAIVALDAETGALRWSFQTVHHDLWDYDVPAQPVLVDIPGPAGPRPALVQGTKQGDVFVLDRRTGEPIHAVEERPVPQGAAEGDRLSPTQPRSAITFMPPPLREQDMWGMTPVDQMLCRTRFRRLRYEGAFTPPGIAPSLRFPGSMGVMDWGGLSVDSDRAVLVANTSAIPYIDELTPRDQAPEEARSIGEGRDYLWGPQEGAPVVVSTAPFLSRFGIPCSEPPWGRINAVDLATGEMLWSHALGTARDSGPSFMPSHLPFVMGVPNIGGAITTRGGLTFVGATVDRYLRAIDTSTGRVLWRGRLPASAHSTPMTYVSARSGRQFVVVAAGGHSSMGPHRSDSIVAFALAPEQVSTAREN